MNRRQMFRALASVAAVFALPALPAPKAIPPARKASDSGNPLFGGQAGRFDGVKIEVTPEAARVYSSHLADLLDRAAAKAYTGGGKPWA